jgi:hypothetical protein
MTCLIQASEECKLKSVEALNQSDYNKLNSMGLIAVALTMAAATVQECLIAIDIVIAIQKVKRENE